MSEMISVIICSINSELRQNAIENIRHTIGVEHEVIAHDNTKDTFGICKVYNQCAKRAKYDYLCFVHEDISFLSPDWGKELIANTHADTGVIGLAGGMVKTVYPVSWGDVGKAYARCNYYEIYKGRRVHRFHNPNNENYAEVLLLDGLFLFTRKQVWEENHFDEHTFHGFHMYDQDFSFQVARHYKNYVCNTIELLHFSRGSFSMKWYDEAVRFSEKWNDQLPKSIPLLDSKAWRKVNSRALYVLIKRYLIKNNAGNSLINKYLFEFVCKYPAYRRMPTLLFKYLLKQFRRL